LCSLCVCCPCTPKQRCTCIACPQLQRTSPVSSQDQDGQLMRTYTSLRVRLPLRIKTIFNLIMATAHVGPCQPLQRADHNNVASIIEHRYFPRTNFCHNGLIQMPTLFQACPCPDPQGYPSRKNTPLLRARPAVLTPTWNFLDLLSG
jgi:hypothetical protein